MAPEPTIGIPPLYVAPAPAPAHAAPPGAHGDRRRMLMAAGAGAALALGVVTVWLLASGTSAHKTSTPTPAGVRTALSAKEPVVSTSPPGTRSGQVPDWANKAIGRSAKAQITLGSGDAGFGSENGNHCAANGVDVVCAAADFWTNSHSLPTGADCIGVQVTHPVSLFWLQNGQPGTGLRCTTMPTALQQPLGTVPDNQVIAMGQTGVYCLVDHVPGQSGRTGIACWNPNTNHGFMITSQDKRLW
jgi:hypothetical protein